MIVMPGGLHLAEVAISYVPRDVDLVLVMNGLTRWEAAWARRHLPATEFVPTATVLEHGPLLDVLFDCMRQNFGILDYDCFVFKPDYFARMRDIGGGVSMHACFFRRNNTLGLDVPETFFLFFNVAHINQLRRRYSVGSQRIGWDAVPIHARQRLQTIGIDSDHFPEEHKAYFDTLRLLMMLGLCDGTPCHFLATLPTTPRPFADLFHVGGVSHPWDVSGTWTFRGSYFWRLALEASRHEDLRAYYGQRYSIGSAAALLESDPEEAERMGGDFRRFCEEIIARHSTQVRRGQAR
jgi:hypothetical protein